VIEIAVVDKSYGYLACGALPSSSGDFMSTKDPCISICKFTDDICIGCGRSKREIKSWKKMDKDEKRSVLAESAMRLIKLKGAGRRKKK